MCSAPDGDARRSCLRHRADRRSDAGPPARDRCEHARSHRRPDAGHKEQAGLTYRQLEANAAQYGDVLARSTAADMLRRESLPRPEAVLAFVRARGRGGSAAAWLDARNRPAAAEPLPAGRRRTVPAEHHRNVPLLPTVLVELRNTVPMQPGVAAEVAAWAGAAARTSG
ncbi:hypothetical protein ACFVVU_09470 [Kitasatospora sp. NPDC057965]|uniref:hypothetical protein n=1 Tax=Kitasatospora sp. NPDC057965 TaxID=3346291 RepID=UPI0036D865AF